MQNSSEIKSIKGILKNPNKTSVERDGNTCQSKSRLSYNLFNSNGSTNTTEMPAEKQKDPTELQSENSRVLDDPNDETIEEKEKRMKFENRRRGFYSEYKRVKIARTLIAEELDDNEIYFG